MARIRDYNPILTVACSLSRVAPLTIAQMATVTGLPPRRLRAVRAELIRQGLAARHSRGVLAAYGPRVRVILDAYWCRIHAIHEDVRMRRCIECRRPFPSKWAGHRRCGLCLDKRANDRETVFRPSYEPRGRYAGAGYGE